MENLFDKFVLGKESIISNEEEEKQETKENEDKVKDEGREDKGKQDSEKNNNNKEDEQAGEDLEKTQEINLEDIPEDVKSILEKAQKGEEELTQEEVDTLLEHDLIEDSSNQDAEGIYDIAKELHEKNGWEYDQSYFEENYDNSIDGLNEFIRTVISENEPEFASDEVKEFNDFVIKGGDPKKFLDTYYGNVIDYENLDKEDETAKKAVYSQYLKSTTKFSDAKIAKEVDSKMDLGEIDEEWDEVVDYLKKNEEEMKEAIKNQQEEMIKAQEKQYNDFLDNMKSKISSMKEVAGYDLNEEESEKLFKFGFEKDKSGKTPYQKLRENDPDMDVKLLYFAMKGLHKDKLMRDAETKIAKKLKVDLSRYTDKTAKSNNNVAPDTSKKTGGGENNFKKWVI